MITLEKLVARFLFFVLFFSASFIYAQKEETENYLKGYRYTTGPKTVKMNSIAEIDVPKGFVFTEANETVRLMESFGNPRTGEEIGMLAPEDLSWFMVFEFSDIGYVEDDEKDDLDADELMESFKEGNEEGNKIRAEKGWGTLEIVGWKIQPRYNEKTNNLEYAFKVKDNKGFESINHATKLLGRKGVVTVTLVADPSLFESVLPDFYSSLKSFSYLSGNKYAEFTEGDKIAEYGLTGLVLGGGVALAAKSGLLKYLWKILVGVFVAGAAFFKRVFGRFFNKNNREEVVIEDKEEQDNV